MSIEVRWRVYRFECPEEGCSMAFEDADHHRRDPSTMSVPTCAHHDVPYEFVEARPLLEVENITKHLGLLRLENDASFVMDEEPETTKGT